MKSAKLSGAHVEPRGSVDPASEVPENQWAEFCFENVRRLPHCYGVYWLGDGDRCVWYIGEGHFPGVLKTKESNALSGIDNTIQKYPVRFRWRRTSTKPECRRLQDDLLEEFRQKHGELPPFNEKVG